MKHFCNKLDCESTKANLQAHVAGALSHLRMDSELKVELVWCRKRHRTKPAATLKWLGDLVTRPPSTPRR